MRNITTLLFSFACCLYGGDARAQQFNIAYNAYDTVRKDYDVYIMHADGSGKQNLTNHTSVDWTYYAYRDTIYFVSDRDTCSRCFFLYAMDSKGSGLRRISNLMLEDSWMSGRNNNTEMIVSGRTGPSRFQLYLLNTIDGSYRAITNDTAAYYNDPLFINDGRQIVYRYKSQRRNRSMKTELWIMNSDGSAARQLTRFPADDTTAPWHAYHAGAPRWNQRLGAITYQSLQKGAYHIYAVTPDGRKQWKLTDFGKNEGWHHWSADGSWLVTDMFDDDQRRFTIGLLKYGEKQPRILTGKNDWPSVYAPLIIEE